ncbi:hypothetical protein, partial [Prevotellamassilia timonensis]|uniref:hypothetical protein n=1 Tax=Prevotellamassilia timonensis TaxID=1852370 RepID=UPI0030788158
AFQSYENNMKIVLCSVAQCPVSGMGRRVITNLGVATPSKQSSFLMFPTFGVQSYHFFVTPQTFPTFFS